MQIIGTDVVINLLMTVIIGLASIVAVIVCHTPAALRRLAAWSESRGLYIEHKQRLQAKMRRMANARERELAEMAKATEMIERDIDAAIATGFHNAAAAAVSGGNRGQVQ